MLYAISFTLLALTPARAVGVRGLCRWVYVAKGVAWCFFLPSSLNVREFSPAYAWREPWRGGVCRHICGFALWWCYYPRALPARGAFA